MASRFCREAEPSLGAKVAGQTEYPQRGLPTITGVKRDVEPSMYNRSLISNHSKFHALPHS